MKNAVVLTKLYDLPVNEKHTLDFGEFQIEITRRTSDYMCRLLRNGEQLRWNCHKYLDFAVGYAVLTYVHMIATGEIK